MQDHIQSERFRSLVEGLMTKHQVPGLTIAITHDDEESAAAFGFADVRANTKCEVDKIFDIASSSKSMTAAAVAILVRDERWPDVRFEAKMTDLLPGDFVMPEGYEDVTLEDIISHRSGMAE
ncbi:beta-lactamase/transpeptidase-like protein [Sarocladium strictum]